MVTQPEMPERAFVAPESSHFPPTPTQQFSQSDTGRGRGPHMGRQLHQDGSPANSTTTFTNNALDLAAAGWEVFPLRGKLPAIAGGHGVLDATRDISVIIDWGRHHPTANIGARVPETLLVIDTDPRHGGEDNLQAIAALRGGIPDTLTVFSGRGDGGRHRYYRNPAAPINARNLPDGVDLKTHAGYCVVPPSLHPDTGKPYTWLDPLMMPADPPPWLLALLRPIQPVNGRPFRPEVVNDGDSIADWFCTAATWPQILIGWAETGGGWRHPRATAPVSATIRHDMLFVYSTNTAFQPTGAGDPHGYTKFRAWGVLNYGGDLRAAARAARALRQGASA